MTSRASGAVDPPRVVVTDAMIDRAVSAYDTDRGSLHDILRAVLEAALTDPERCGNCGGSLSHVKPKAKWCSAACKMAAHRARQPSQNRNQRRRPRPGGRQASFGPLVRILTAHFVDEGFYDEARAERVARNLVVLALPRRQRRPRRVA